MNTTIGNNDTIVNYEMDAALFSCKVALSRWLYCFGNNKNPYEVREEASQVSWKEMAKYNSHTRPYIK